MVRMSDGDVTHVCAVVVTVVELLVVVELWQVRGAPVVRASGKACCEQVGGGASR